MSNANLTSMTSTHELLRGLFKAVWYCGDGGPALERVEAAMEEWPNSRFAAIAGLPFAGFETSNSSCGVFLGSIESTEGCPLLSVFIVESDLVDGHVWMIRVPPPR